jgi:ABC-type antimicrobial peptide transport system permease subunit
MSSSIKFFRAYGGIAFGLLGGILIGFGIIILVISPLMVSFNEEMTNQINRILDLWRTRHPGDDLPTVYTPSQVYLGWADAQLYGVISIVLGLALGAIGFYETHSSTKTVPPQP